MIYDYISEYCFKNKNGDKNANENALEVEIEKNKERLNKTQQMMPDGEIDKADYKEIKCKIESEIYVLLAQQSGFNQIEVEYKVYLKNVLTAIHYLCTIQINVA